MQKTVNFLSIASTPGGRGGWTPKAVAGDAPLETYKAVIADVFNNVASGSWTADYGISRWICKWGKNSLIQISVRNLFTILANEESRCKLEEQRLFSTGSEHQCSYTFIYSYIDHYLKVLQGVEVYVPTTILSCVYELVRPHRKKYIYNRKCRKSPSIKSCVN